MVFMCACIGFLFAISIFWIWSKMVCLQQNVTYLRDERDRFHDAISTLIENTDQLWIYAQKITGKPTPRESDDEGPDEHVEPEVYLNHPRKSIARDANRALSKGFVNSERVERPD